MKACNYDVSIFLIFFPVELLSGVTRVSSPCAIFLLRAAQLPSSREHVLVGIFFFFSGGASEVIWLSLPDG